jgi:thioredoxin 1
MVTARADARPVRRRDNATMSSSLQQTTEPTIAEVQAWAGPAVIEFGTSWCGWCRGAQPLIRSALEGSGVRHVKVEDGPGRPLGRHYRVKLWPTLVFLKDGQEKGRVTRPSDEAALKAALAEIR